MTPRPAILTRLASAILLSIVIARCLMLETIRTADAFADAAGARGPGAATSIVLDWLGFAPALLILARRVVDRSFAIRFTAADALLTLLAAWTLASVSWADDRFLSLISAARIAGGVAIFWAAGQLVTRPAHLRVVVGVVVGLLIVNVVQGAIYQNFDLAELRQYWTNNKAQILADRGWREGDYIADRFELKLLAGEMLNFNLSANVLGAVVVTAALTAIGAALQRVEDRDDAGWAGALLLAAAGSVYVLAHTGSKASAAALVLGVALLAAWRVTRGWLATHRTLAFASGLLAVALGVVSVIAFGLSRGGLPSDSLNFRWRYWVGSWPLVREHPFRGIGWGNFADFYLAHRLPAAAEEIQDPHSFPVKWLVELGGIGLILGVAWLVAWAWRVLSGPGNPLRFGGPVIPASVRAAKSSISGRTQAGMPVPPKSPHAGMPSPLPITRVLLIFLPALLLCVLTGVDLTADGSYVFLEVMRRVMFVGLISLAVGLVCIGPRASPDAPFHVDERPAPWLVAGLFLGVLMLLLQSTIDIALFQPGPWSLTMLAMGALLGISRSSRDATSSPITAIAPRLGEDQRRRCVAAISGIASIGWVIAGFYPTFPVVLSERFATAGDDSMAQKKSDMAWILYGKANGPVANFDYRLKEAEAYIRQDRPHAEPGSTYTTRDPLDAAIAAAPHHALSWLTRSRFLSSEKNVSPADANQAIDDFGRAVELNPNDVDLRVEYADLLARSGLRDEAVAQVAKALALDDRLDAAEPKRLARRAPQRLAELRARLAG